MRRFLLLVAVWSLATLATAPGARPALADLLAAGDAFPEWTLPDQTGAPRSSAELAGRSYLMWFYPKAMTPGCTAEGRGLRDAHDRFAEREVVVLGVSFDPPADNARFVEEEGFPFALLSDSSKTLAIAVGAATGPDQGYARRISYLVGSDGRVRVVYADVDPATHAATVLADLERADADEDAEPEVE